jgi:signal peptidase I
MSRDTPQSGFGRWRRKRRYMKDSRLLLKESRRVLKRHAQRLKKPVVEEFESTMDSLKRARERRDVEALRKHIKALDRLLERHLAFARKSAFREYAESIGIAVLIALLLRAFVIEPFKIPSGSMIPTLKVGDHIFVSKFSYGIQIPFTRIKLFRSTPSRGDVVVFIWPRDESKDFIKRIVAIGGDTVAVRRNVIYLNGKPIKPLTLSTKCRYRDRDESGQVGDIRDCVAREEHLDDNTYRVILDRGGSSMLDLEPTKVPEGHVFVMGDNRDNSHDSRAWGFVPEENIKGKALLVWLSFGDPDGIRWSRFFDLVHHYTDDIRKTPIHDGLTEQEKQQAISTR